MARIPLQDRDEVMGKKLECWILERVPQHASPFPNKNKLGSGRDGYFIGTAVLKYGHVGASPTCSPTSMGAVVELVYTAVSKTPSQTFLLVTRNLRRRIASKPR